MVRRCAWGTCNADCRYPEHMAGVKFITFPNPKTNLEKCLRWIKACSRPHDQLNVQRVNKNKVICSTHSMGGNGPTDTFPDPVPADGSPATPTRPPPKRRRLHSPQESSLIEITSTVLNENENREQSCKDFGSLPSTCDSSCQTDAGAVKTASVETNPAGKDENDDVNSRIVGGKFADRGEYPYLIVLEYNDRFACGGTILNKRTILTAAHCVSDDPCQWFGKFSIKAGDYKTNVEESTEQKIHVKSIKMHPQYSTNQNGEEDRDIAILKLETPLTYNDYVKKVSLPSKSFEKRLLSWEKCVVAGIGVIDNFGPIPVKVKEATVNVLSKSECSPGLTEYTKYILCTYNKEKGVCYGDSGGPLICFDKKKRAYQVGVTSFGLRNCWDGLNMYARVSTLRHWMKKYY